MENIFKIIIAVYAIFRIYWAINTEKNINLKKMEGVGSSRKPAMVFGYTRGPLLFHLHAVHNMSCDVATILFLWRA